MCGGDGKLVVEQRRISVGHYSTLVDDEFYRCATCGAEWTVGDQMEVIQQKAAKLIREEHGLLSPERIRAIRTRYGWTQSDLEQVLGAGPKTVVRWEKGSVVPAAAANTLLEVLERNPDVARQLSLERSVCFKQELSWHGALMNSTWGSPVSGPMTTRLWYPACSPQLLKSVWVSPQPLVSAWVSLKPQKSTWAPWVSGPNLAWHDLSFWLSGTVEIPRAHSIPDELEALLKAA